MNAVQHSRRAGTNPVDTQTILSKFQKMQAQGFEPASAAIYGLFHLMWESAADRPSSISRQVFQDLITPKFATRNPNTTRVISSIQEMVFHNGLVNIYFERTSDHRFFGEEGRYVVFDDHVRFLVEFMPDRLRFRNAQGIHGSKVPHKALLGSLPITEGCVYRDGRAELELDAKLVRKGIELNLAELYD